MPKCAFNKVAKQLLNLLHVFRTSVPKNTSKGLLPEAVVCSCFTKYSADTRPEMKEHKIFISHPRCHFNI